MLFDPGDGGRILVSVYGRSPGIAAGGLASGGKRLQDGRGAEDAETGKREGGRGTGAEGRVKGRCGFVTDPARGIQAIARDKPLHLGEKRQDVGEVCGRKDGTGRLELQPMTRFGVVNNRSIHAGNPS